MALASAPCRSIQHFGDIASAATLLVLPRRNLVFVIAVTLLVLPRRNLFFVFAANRKLVSLGRLSIDKLDRNCSAVGAWPRSVPTDEDRLWLRLLGREHGIVAPRLVSIVEAGLQSVQLQRAPPPARRPDQRNNHHRHPPERRRHPRKKRRLRRRG